MACQKLHNVAGHALQPTRIKMAEAPHSQHFHAADQGCHTADNKQHLRLASTWLGATPRFRSALRSAAARTSGSAASLALHASGGPGSGVFFLNGRSQSYSSFRVQDALRRRIGNKPPRLHIFGAADHRWPTGARFGLLTQRVHVSSPCPCPCVRGHGGAPVLACPLRPPHPSAASAAAPSASPRGADTSVRGGGGGKVSSKSWRNKVAARNAKQGDCGG